MLRLNLMFLKRLKAWQKSHMRMYTITVMNFRTAVFMRMLLCILRERLRKQKILNMRSLLKLNNFEVILYQFFFAEEVRLLDKINQIGVL